MRTKPPTPRDRLSHELVTLLPWKKSKTTSRSRVNDLEEDEERTYSNEIGGRGGKKLDAIAMQGSIEEEPKPNLDQVTNNIQIELVVFVEHVVSIIESAVTIIESFQPFQHVVWRAPKSRGETKLKVSQSQVAESRLGSTLPASNSRKG